MTTEALPPTEHTLPAMPIGASSPAAGQIRDSPRRHVKKRPYKGALNLHVSMRGPKRGRDGVYSSVRVG